MSCFFFFADGVWHTIDTVDRLGNGQFQNLLKVVFRSDDALQGKVTLQELAFVLMVRVYQ